MTIRLILATLLALAAPTASGAAEWRQHPGPILTPSQAWEDETVQEPTVLYDAKKKLYRMWYTGGYSMENGLGYATSRDGIHWGKYSRNPVLGQGGSGLPGNATHFHVMRHAGIYYAFYNYDNPWQSGSIYAATSTDGKRWRPRTQPVLIGDWNSGWANGNCNSYVWKDTTGWHMLFDTMNRQTGLWKTGLAHGLSPLRFTVDPFGPLDSLSVGGMYGGKWLTGRPGAWRLYYHASESGDNFPTDIYEATSSNLYDWRPNPDPVVWRSQRWQFDQVADPSIANGRMFFDGLDNTDLVKIRSAIGVAVRR